GRRDRPESALRHRLRGEGWPVLRACGATRRGRGPLGQRRPGRRRRAAFLIDRWARAAPRAHQPFPNTKREEVRTVPAAPHDSESPLGWPTHPAAELFPMLPADELSELVDDIRAHGLLEPVWLYQDPDRGTVLLDGRNRALACQKAGVEIRTRVYTGDDPIGFSIAQNLKRRHLTTGQKAAVAHAALPLFEEEARRRMAAAAAEEQRRRAAEAAERERKEQQRQQGAGGPQGWADRPTPGAEE